MDLDSIWVCLVFVFHFSSEFDIWLDNVFALSMILDAYVFIIIISVVVSSSFSAEC